MGYSDTGPMEGKDVTKIAELQGEDSRHEYADTVREKEE